MRTPNFRGILALFALIVPASADPSALPAVFCRVMRPDGAADQVFSAPQRPGINITIMNDDVTSGEALDYGMQLIRAPTGAAVRIIPSEQFIFGGGIRMGIDHESVVMTPQHHPVQFSFQLAPIVAFDVGPRCIEQHHARPGVYRVMCDYAVIPPATAFPADAGVPATNTTAGCSDGGTP